MTDTSLTYLSATQQAQLVRDKEVSPCDLVEASLARIEEVNPKINAFCFVYPEEARELAKQAEAAVMRGDALGPLHGVPIGIKDFTPTRGKTTTRGSVVFKDWVPDFDPAIVRRLQAAGGIMVGKTTTAEFAFSSFTQSHLWGVTRNPWDLKKTPGGSSGGSGAAVAAGCVALAEGSDMGGSVRIPAALCGVVGLKPSLGRIPMDILPTVFDSISHFGPLARSVEDAALFLSVASGPDERDISSLPDRLDFTDWQRKDLKGLKIALSTDLGFYALDPDVEANCRAAAAALAARGATVEEVPLRWDRSMVDAWYAYWGVYLASSFEGQWEAQRADMNPHLVALMESAGGLGAIEFKKLEHIRTRQWHALCNVFDDYDALICPTMALPAQAADLDDSNFDSEDCEGRYHGFDMTSLFNNISQCPVLSVPSGFTADGLPTAVQIVGRRFQDLSALQIGALLEADLGLTDRHPPL